MAAQKTKTTTKTSAPVETKNAPPIADAPEVEGWETVASSQEAEGFLKEEDLPPGAIVQGTIEDARLIADTEKSGYRVLYAIALEKAVGRFDAGALVLFGEKHKMRALRGLPLGSRVRVEVGEKVKLKGGRSMVALDIKTQKNGAAGVKSVQAHLTDTFKAMGGAADEWNTTAGEASPF